MKNILFLICLFLFSGCGDNPNLPIEFNQDKWLKGDRKLRGQMVNNLIGDSLLIGKTKKEVLTLLGDQGDTTGNLSYIIDYKSKNTLWGLNDVWLFELQVHFDTLSHRAVDVTCRD